jgi:nicotinate-nucleotide adenylyltransferase
LIKVAIFGGSFDPPHKGHQAVVEKALKGLDIDKLIILPAFLNPFKESTLASPEERLAWCRQLFGNIPGVEISDYEIRSGRPVFTSESLRHFQKTYDVAYLIIGADNLASITKWHEFDRINSDITWVIADREEHPLHTEMLQNWVLLKVDTPISSTAIRESGDLSMVDNRIKDEVSALLANKGKNE